MLWTRYKSLDSKTYYKDIKRFLSTQYGLHPKFNENMKSVKELFKSLLNFELDYLKNDFYLLSNHIKMTFWCKISYIFYDYMLELGIALICIFVLLSLLVLQMQTDQYGRVVNRIYKKTELLLRSRDKVV